MSARPTSSTSSTAGGPRSCSAASSPARAKQKWSFNQSSMFLDFLAGNQTFHCTPWGNPTRTYFGWQRPCYLLGEGYAKTFKELMEDTDWDRYGTGNYEKCADCMVHSGYEATAVTETIRRPWKAAAQALRGIRTDGPMAPEIPLTNQRPAEYVFSAHVEQAMARIKARPSRGRRRRLSCQYERYGRRLTALRDTPIRSWPSSPEHPACGKDSEGRVRCAAKAS